MRVTTLMAASLALQMTGIAAVGQEVPDAKKSPDECAALSTGLSGKERERKMMACLLGKPVEKPTHFIEAMSYSTNSAGGIEPEVVFLNPNAASPVKYVRLTLRFFNQVGDPIRSEIGSGTTASLRFSGPLSADDEPKAASWEPVFYNFSTHCIRIESIQVDFMNGKKHTFTGREVRKALKPGMENDCRAVSNSR